MRDKAKPAGRQGRKVTGLLDSRTALEKVVRLFFMELTLVRYKWRVAAVIL
jgi:hypothetical protein